MILLKKETILRLLGPMTGTNVLKFSGTNAEFKKYLKRLKRITEYQFDEAKTAVFEGITN